MNFPCTHYECPNRNDSGCCNTAACTNPKYNELQIINVGIPSDISSQEELIYKNSAVLALVRLRDLCSNANMAFALNWAVNTIRRIPSIGSQKE